MGNAIFAAIICLFAGFFYWETGNFPQSLLSASSGPELFPRIILSCIIILGLLIMLRDFRKQEHFIFRSLFQGKTGIVAASLPIYLAAIYWLGFCPASFLMLLSLFCVLSPEAMGKAFIIRSAVLSAVLTTSIYYLFNNVFHIMLPAGPLGC